MKKIMVLCLLAFSFLSLSYAQEWQTDLNEAEQLAAKEDKAIILVFQGSDWCGPCIKMDKQIWSAEEFKNYAKDHFIMLKADFPRRKQNKLSDEQQEKNNALAEKYNRGGYFPFVVVLDKDGQLLGETGYKNLSVSEYIKHLETFIPEK